MIDTGRLYRRREKNFGPAQSRPLDNHAKDRIWAAAAAYNLANKTPRQHWGPLTWATLRVLRALLWHFHDADGTGRCFPGIDALAGAAKCHRDSVCVALKALETAGLLTWSQRIIRVGRRERDLLGDWGMTWQTLRTSNDYRLIDPREREPSRKPAKSENPTRTQNLDFKLTKTADNRRQPSGARLDGAQVTPDLLGEQSNPAVSNRWSNAGEVAKHLLRRHRRPS